MIKYTNFILAVFLFVAILIPLNHASALQCNSVNAVCSLQDTCLPGTSYGGNCACGGSDVPYCSAPTFDKFCGSNFCNFAFTTSCQCAPGPTSGGGGGGGGNVCSPTPTVGACGTCTIPATGQLGAGFTNGCGVSSCVLCPVNCEATTLEIAPTSVSANVGDVKNFQAFTNRPACNSTPGNIQNVTASASWSTSNSGIASDAGVGTVDIYGGLDTNGDPIWTTESTHDFRAVAPGGPVTITATLGTYAPATAEMTVYSGTCPAYGSPESTVVLSSNNVTVGNTVTAWVPPGYGSLINNGLPPFINTNTTAADRDATNPSEQGSNFLVFHGKAPGQARIVAQNYYYYSPNNASNCVLSDGILNVSNPPPVVVNGACDPATNGNTFASKPSSNLCSAGTASAVSGGATGPWNWTCNGSGTGSNASCSATYTASPINGACGSGPAFANGKVYPNGTTDYGGDAQCADGTPSNTAFPTVGSSANWTCSGQNSGLPSGNCSASQAAPGNTPPNAPTIQQTTGTPGSGVVGTDYNFRFTAIDPQNDQIQYAIDWDNNDTVDQWLPPGSYVNSGTSQNQLNNWGGPGLKSFKAMAKDNLDLLSPWSNVFTINITNACSPVNGGWSAWSSCSGGTQTRTCDNPSQSCGGATCSGSSTQSCTPPPVACDVTVNKGGQGIVTTIAPPNAINCGISCGSATATLTSGTPVTLRASTQNASRIFTGWTGACSGTGDCNLTCNGSQTVRANFSINPNFKEF